MLSKPFGWVLVQFAFSPIVSSFRRRQEPVDPSEACLLVSISINTDFDVLLEDDNGEGDDVIVVVAVVVAQNGASISVLVVHVSPPGRCLDSKLLSLATVLGRVL